MIYFTEISRDINGKQEKAELLTFQFYMKELPESIKTPFFTKVNHIEYNGGFYTNQIMGVFPREVEWEGCFYGTYTKPDGSRYTAKERAYEIKKFMGRPIRVGFGMPQGTDEFVPGEDNFPREIIGKEDSKLGGDVGVYIIEEYEPEVINYSDVNYRIKLVPHQRQEKIKPTLTQSIPIKLSPENLANAGSAAANAAGKARNGTIRKAVAAGSNAKDVGEQMGPEDINPRQSARQRRQAVNAEQARINAAASNGAKPKPNPAPAKKPGK